MSTKRHLPKHRLAAALVVAAMAISACGQKHRDQPVAALSTTNTLAANSGTGPHQLFAPLEARGVNAEFNNQGDCPVKLEIVKEEQNEKADISRGEFFIGQFDRVNAISVWFGAGKECKLGYQITYAPTTGGSEPANPSYWMAANTCHGHSTDGSENACVQGVAGLVCNQSVGVGETTILPVTQIGDSQLLTHAPMRIEVQYCANTFCDPQTVEGGEIRVLVNRSDPALDVESDPLNLDNPNFVNTLSNVQGVTIECATNNFDKCIVRWQICHVPGPWLTAS